MISALGVVGPRLDSPSSVRRFLAMASLFCTALLIYASLVPLDFRPLPWDEAWKAWRGIPWLSLDVFHRADWVANALVVLPAGMLAAASVDWGRPTNRQLIIATPIIAFGLALVVIGIELVQVWFPPRTMSLNDVAAGFIGAALGPILWSLVGPQVERMITQFVRLERTRDRLAWLGAAWLVCLFLLSVLPLDVILSRAEWQQKLATGRVQWNPVGAGVSWQAIIGEATLAALSLAPIGVYCSLAQTPGKSRWLLWLLPPLLQLIQLPFYTKSFSSWAILGGWIGGWSAYHLSRRSDRVAAIASRPVVWATAWSVAVLFAAWFLLHRYDRITDDPAEIAARFSAAWNWPLVKYYAQSEYRAYTNLLEKFAVFAAIGACSCGWSRTVAANWRKWVIGSTSLFVVALAAGIEIAQVFLPPLVPDMADSIVYCLGLAVGFYSLQFVWRPASKLEQTAPLAPESAQPTSVAPGTPNDRWFCTIAFAMGSLLLAYGSLVPFHFRELPLLQAVSEFSSLFQHSIFHWGQTADWSLNFTLMIPIAFCAMGAIADGRQRWLVWCLAPLAILSCLAISVAVEFAQLWTEGRVASSRDVVAQTLGACAGALLWIALGSRFSAWRRSFIDRRDPPSRLEWLLQAYVIGLAVYSVVPVNIIMSPGELLQKYRSGMIELVPFTFDQGGILNTLYSLLTDILLYVPVGMCAAVAWLPSGQKIRPVSQSLLLGGTFAVAIEVVQLMIVGRYTSTSDVILGFAGVVLGVVLLSYGRRERWQFNWASNSAAQAASICLLGALLYAAFLAAIFWAPFDFTSDFSQARHRLETFVEVPFADMHGGSDLVGIFAAARKILWFFPLGALLGMAAVRNSAGVRLGLSLGAATAAIIVVAVAIELGQVFLPSKVADSTDVILSAIGGLLGLFATLIANRHPQDNARRQASPTLRHFK